MTFSHLVFFSAEDPAARISGTDLEAVREVFGALPGLDRARLYTPETASDLYNDDGHSPVFGFQLYFDGIEALEAAIGQTGALQALAVPGALPSLSGAQAAQQAMLVRSFHVPDPAALSPKACSYVVHYPGPAADTNAWLSHYIHHHPPIMRRFPGVRELEILTRIDWIDALPWRRVNHLQRNRILFDSAKALEDALHSPVRHEMRADFGDFPPYEGGNFHYPVATEEVLPRV
ncbi:EthD family reductase [Aurantimonas sp. VKM B-3413]|uniref:EthD family reductase n=1 Tax=Aurantimonas sp. VKM B-3413 TaxID=2779401 RepID=UPI001E5B317A|nr:EthD family reductase [Aurantimonas sp. VKM B-3413]MCB8840319.1 EthD family reductase [Aurantimonas sp. VKM B-3413]